MRAAMCASLGVSARMGEAGQDEGDKASGRDGIMEAQSCGSYAEVAEEGRECRIGRCRTGFWRSGGMMRAQINIWQRVPFASVDRRVLTTRKDAFHLLKLIVAEHSIILTLPFVQSWKVGATAGCCFVFVRDEAYGHSSLIHQILPARVSESFEECRL